MHRVEKNGGNEESLLMGGPRLLWGRVIKLVKLNYQSFLVAQLRIHRCHCCGLGLILGLMYAVGLAKKVLDFWDLERCGFVLIWRHSGRVELLVDSFCSVLSSSLPPSLPPFPSFLPFLPSSLSLFRAAPAASGSSQASGSNGICSRQPAP